ncbi:MAG: hypothetical protein LBK72_10920 [Bifidobacteriaceae bacterium]|nr:hypothetical protein [Bifidobacteriaceae bacterium]
MRRCLAGTAVTTICLVAIAVPVRPDSSPAEGADVSGKVFEINSLDFSGSDKSPNDGVCATTTKDTCTLRAALEEANAYKASHSTTNVTVTVAPGFSGGTISLAGRNATSGMVSDIGAVFGDSKAAFFAVTAGITVDLEGKIDFGGVSGTTTEATVFYIQATGAVLRNFGNIVSSWAGVVIGKDARNVVVEGGRSVQTTTNRMKRMVHVNGGAQGVTLRDLTVGRLANSASSADAGAIFVDRLNTSDSAVVKNLLIERVVFDSTPLPGGTCTETDARGCSNRGIWVNATVGVEGMTITHCLFTGFNHERYQNVYAVYMGLATGMKDVRIVDNRFIDNATWNFTNAGLIVFARSGMAGSNVISGNTFENRAGNLRNWGGAIVYIKTSTGSSGTVTIEDNYFNLPIDMAGKPTVKSTIHLVDTGAVTVRRNTFGPLSPSQSSTVKEETDHAGPLLLANATGNAGTANRQIAPWYPSVAAVEGTRCQVTVTANPPTTGTAPKLPVDIDVYYTATDKAEVYLGSQTITTSGKVPLTVPYSVEAGGYLRLQTQGSPSATGGGIESSQFSRTLAVAGADPACLPGITVTREPDQDSETMKRTARFLVTSEMPVAMVDAGEEGLSAASFDFAASSAPGVVVSDLEEMSPTRFIVSVRAADTGRIEPLVAPGVRSMSGQLLAPAAHENWVDYTNPLSISPTSVTVGDNPVTSATYTVVSRLAPNRVVQVDVAVSGDVTVSPTPVLLGASLSSVVAVTAIADGVGAGDHGANVAHTVTSTDPDFDGLMLPVVTVVILDQDLPPPEPDVKVIKRAWSWHGGGTPTYAEVVADPAREIGTGSALPGATVVWWTYEAVNVGEVALTGVTVVDPELGVPGDLVCEIPELPVGASEGCAASGPLVDQTDT